MIRLNIPLTDDRELNEVRDVLRSGHLTQGPKTEEFERLVANYVGSSHAFAMSSCTTALHLALVVADIGPGDEVLVPDFTFPATANVVVQTGAKPILVDIDLASFTVNPLDFAAKITSRTRAAIPVHTFGCSADMEPLIELARAGEFPLIEDAACAIGTSYMGMMCGSLADMACFSFHPRKVITTGEGGMITTGDAGFADRISLLRSHGGVRIGGRYRYEEAGFNYRLSDIHGAIGVAQMEKLPALIEGKRSKAAALRERLSEVAGVIPPAEPVWGGHIYQSFVVLLDEALDRDQVISRMRTHGIETTLGTYALHDQPFFQREYGYRSGDLTASHQAFSQTLTLPLYPQLTDDELDRIAEALILSIKSQ